MDHKCIALFKHNVDGSGRNKLMVRVRVIQDASEAGSSNGDVDMILSQSAATEQRQQQHDQEPTDVAVQSESPPQ